MREHIQIYIHIYIYMLTYFHICVSIHNMYMYINIYIYTHNILIDIVFPCMVAVLEPQPGELGELERVRQGPAASSLRSGRAAPSDPGARDLQPLVRVPGLAFWEVQGHGPIAGFMATALTVSRLQGPYVGQAMASLDFRIPGSWYSGVSRLTCAAEGYARACAVESE